jgi:hypothetical protein
MRSVSPVTHFEWYEAKNTRGKRDIVRVANPIEQRH